MRRTLILGATSAIAEATAREFASRGDTIFLAARNERALQALADDLRMRGARIAGTAFLDAGNLKALPEVVDRAIRSLGGLDRALIAHGTLSNQSACLLSGDALHEDFVVNALSVMALSASLGYFFATQKHGVLAVISSVAGDRGRQSNYVYGAAKAAVTTFLCGLRQQLYDSGVRVVTIKPGFVSTPMTASFKKGALWADPPRIARDIRRAMDRGTPVVYTPWFWRPIMAIIRCVPERIFQRLRF
jgi:short-subunit dehydrogenase